MFHYYINHIVVKEPVDMTHMAFLKISVHFLNIKGIITKYYDF